MGEKHGKLTAYLSAPEAWSLSLGTSVGWGCLVITCSTYLSTAGPLGTVLGLIIGAVVMVVVGRSYTYLMSRFPDAGGVLSYTKEAFGDDFGILAV